MALTLGESSGAMWIGYPCAVVTATKPGSDGIFCVILILCNIMRTDTTEGL